MNTPDTEVDEDTKGGVCSKFGAWKGGSYGMDGNGVQHRHTCKPPTNDDLLAEWDELIKVSTKLELRNWLKDLLTSRDTYWKERVRKEVEGMKQPETHEDHCDGYCNESACYLPDRIASNRTLDTLLDNLK